MSKLIVNKKTNDLAREIGFTRLLCTCAGSPDCICKNHNPTKAELQQWLIDNYNILITVNILLDGSFYYIVYKIEQNGYVHPMFECIDTDTYYKEYHIALEEGLVEAIKTIKK